jgi:hypothetical protein
LAAAGDLALASVFAWWLLGAEGASADVPVAAEPRRVGPRGR